MNIFDKYIYISSKQQTNIIRLIESKWMYVEDWSKFNKLNEVDEVSYWSSYCFLRKKFFTIFAKSWHVLILKRMAINGSTVY